MNKKIFSRALFALLLSIYAQASFAQASGKKPELIMYRHNSNSGGNSPAAVMPTDILGTIKWNGLTDIGDIRTGATIHSVTKGVSPGSLRANMIFSTSDGSTLNNHAVLTDQGLFGIGTLDPLYHLDVVGNTHTSGNFYGRIHFDNISTTNDGPNTYFNEAYFERKLRSTLGVPAVPTDNNFGGTLSLAPGGGANDHQLFFGQDGIWSRRADGSSPSWTEPWEKLLASADIKGAPNRVARFLQPDNPSSKLGNSQLYDNGTNVVVGGSVAPFDATPAFDPAYLFNVNGDATISEDARINGSLGIGTAPTSGNRLEVQGNSRISGGARVDGNLLVLSSGDVRGRLVVGNPISTPGNHLLYVNGSAIAEEVVVKLQGNWPDYVLADSYDLKPLSAVEASIKQDKHLPGIPSAAQLAENGLSLGEMQKAQMEKIEELFLYIIQQGKAIEQQQETINRLESELKNLKK